MRLSEIALYENEELLADAEFDRLDLLKSSVNQRIFSFLDSAKYLHEAENANITCIVCRRELVSLLPSHIKGIIVSEEPYVSFWRRHNELQRRREKFATKIGANCNIHPLACIAENNVIIGENVVIEEFVSIKENVVLGDRCIIRSGCVIGGAGYEFKKRKEGTPLAVEHFGGVIIEHDVEIQQLTNVARAIYPDDDTIIKSGTKIDALVHIAHADKIGHNCNIVAGAVIGGSTCLEDNVWVGPNATVSNGLHIGKDARISLGSVVTRNVEPGKTVSGNFAIEHSKFIENIKASIKR